MGFCLQPGFFLLKIRRQARQCRLVDPDTVVFHVRQHPGHTALKRLIDSGRGFPGQQRLEMFPESQRHIRVLGCIGCRVFEGQFIEHLLRPAASCQFPEGNRFVSENHL